MPWPALEPPEPPPAVSEPALFMLLPPLPAVAEPPVPAPVPALPAAPPGLFVAPSSLQPSAVNSEPTPNKYR
jgi:hypothetical protein